MEYMNPIGPKVTNIHVSTGDRAVDVTWEEPSGKTGTLHVIMELDYVGKNDWGWYVINAVGDFPADDAFANHLEEAALAAFEQAEQELEE